jgi:hypothetical protein
MDTTAKLAAFILTVLPHLRKLCAAGDEKTNSSKVRQSSPPWASYLPEMPEPKGCRLVRDPGTDVFTLAAKLGMDPDRIASDDQRQGRPDQGSY